MEGCHGLPIPWDNMDTSGATEIQQTGIAAEFLNTAVERWEPNKRPRSNSFYTDSSTYTSQASHGFQTLEGLEREKHVAEQFNQVYIAENGRLKEQINMDRHKYHLHNKQCVQKISELEHLHGLHHGEFDRLRLEKAALQVQLRDGEVLYQQLAAKDQEKATQIGVLRQSLSSERKFTAHCNDQVTRLNEESAKKCKEFNEVEKTFREQVVTLEGDLLRVEEELRTKSRLLSELDKEHQQLKDAQMSQKKEYQESKTASKEEEARLADRLKDTKDILCDKTRQISSLNDRVADKESRIVELEQHISGNLERNARTIEDKDTQINTANAKLADLQTGLSLSESQYRDTKQQLQQKESELTEIVRSHTKEKQKADRVLEREYTRRKDEVIDLQREIARKSGNEAKLRKVAIAIGERYKKMEATSADLEAAITELKQNMKQKEEEVATQHIIVDEKNKAIKDWQAYYNFGAKLFVWGGQLNAIAHIYFLLNDRYTQIPEYQQRLDSDDTIMARPSTPKSGGKANASNLPLGWDSRTASDGRIYYVNHQARTTQWEHPGETTTETNKDNSDLPSGWEALKTEEGRTYYANLNTKTTTWVRPDIRIADLLTRLPTNWEMRVTGAKVADLVTKLPKNWEMRITGGNNLYFVDHDTRTTTWHFPYYLMSENSSATDEGEKDRLQNPSHETPENRWENNADEQRRAENYKDEETSKDSGDWVLVPKL